MSYKDFAAGVLCIVIVSIIVVGLILTADKEAAMEAEDIRKHTDRMVTE